MMKKIIIITNGRGGKNYRGKRGRKGGYKGKKRY